MTGTCTGLGFVSVELERSNKVERCDSIGCPFLVTWCYGTCCPIQERVYAVVPGAFAARNGLTGLWSQSTRLSAHNCDKCEKSTPCLHENSQCFPYRSTSDPTYGCFGPLRTQIEGLDLSPRKEFVSKKTAGVGGCASNFPTSLLTFHSLSYFPCKLPVS